MSKHIHGENCGCHEHEHNHEHDHHHHDHHHEHDENCSCGCHDHEHIHDRDVDGIHIEHHMHDDACIVSGSLTLSGVYADVKPVIAAKLEELAKAVNDMGGIVGHIKAAAEVKSTEMFSVTESVPMIKTAPEQEITVKLAAIVFAVSHEEVEPLVEAALREISGHKASE